MAKSLKPGDKVEWSSSAGMVKGKIVKELTDETKIKSHVVKASPQNPEYLVKSDASGKTAAHKKEALTKKS